MLLFISNVFAVPQKTKVSLKTTADSSKIVIKHFDQKAINKYRTDEDFNYNGPGTGKPTLWKIFWDWVWDHITRLFRGIPYGGKILEYLLIGGSVAFLAYVIFKSLGLDPIRLWRGEAAKVAVPYSESLEDIHGIDFDAEVEKALTQHNYRLAVRLLYLKCLKQLSDKKLIQWEIDKTNTAYLYELKNGEQRRAFSLLTNRFEYVWYGNFPINQQAFADIDLLFQNFKKQLS
ncbi:MAG: DUF4129 domain-containing protein [Mucilaginibacter sp.]